MTDKDLSELDIRLRRTRFRAWHRGIKEMDLILGHFADAQLAGLSTAELETFEALLEIADTTLYDWVTGRAAPAAEHDTPLLARIREFEHLRNPLWNRSE